MIAVAAQAQSSRALRARREKVVIVTRKTALEELIARFNTVGQVKFYLEHAGQDFAGIQAMHEQYHAVLDRVRKMIPAGVRQHVIDRSFLPQFTFGESDLVVTVGPDGQVVNTAKYLDKQPIVAVNPDPARIEGVLLPFTTRDLGRSLNAAIYGEPSIKAITMAEAMLNDGQRLLAFNDLFIGMRSHVSARYRIEVDGASETQSSSGIIISTGAGSTGWLKSVHTGAARVIGVRNKKSGTESGRFAWDADHLVYVVREPWPSKSTGATLVYGSISRDQPLVVKSEMADGGVIFSDGVESDYLGFTAGLTATVRVSDKKAQLVIKTIYGN